MRQSPMLLFVGLTALLAGCDSVSVREPLGERLDSSEHRALVGIWSFGDSNQLRVRQDAAGELVGGALNWDEKVGRFKVSNVDIVATQLGEYKIVFTRDADNPDRKDAWTFVRCEFVGEEKLNIYGVKARVFQAAVDDGKLKGTTTPRNKNFDTKISSSKAEVEAFISEVGLTNLFFPDPITLKRIAKK